LNLLSKLQMENGTTNTIASHDVPRLRQICDRFLLLNNGRVHYLGAMDDEESHISDPVMRPFVGISYAAENHMPSTEVHDR